MKLIVGLGNPGEKYEKTRHNTGFLVLQELKIRITDLQLPTSNKYEWKDSRRVKAKYVWFDLKGENIELLKPMTRMNDSGIAVSYAKNKHKVPLKNIFVVHDDLDIELGNYKIQKGKGPRDHGGLNSIYKHLGSKDFWHVRVGIGNQKSRVKNQESKIPGEDYVLMKFTDDEMTIVKRKVKEVADELIDLIT